ncbi:MAG TPA: GAF domain-containing protein [Candidatus Angelobacter sp.]
MSRFKELLEEFEGFARTAASVDSLMEHIARRLHEVVTRYNWVGFYLVEDSDPKALVLGPYAGSFSPHKRIPVSSGLCGAAATSGKTVLVNDVSADPRYLAGSPMVKGNLIVPIFGGKVVVAELDVETYFTNTFQNPDQKFIESCASLVGRYMERKR